MVWCGFPAWAGIDPDLSALAAVWERVPRVGGDRPPKPPKIPAIFDGVPRVGGDRPLQNRRRQ